MTRVQLIIPDDDHLNYVRQAQREELTLSAWLRAAAQDRLQRMRRTARFETQADVRSFFAECDRIEGPAREPEWEDHLATMRESRRL
ncbi:MAG: hypothetical protein F4Y26_00225 [Gammaproteobacteria bacterium]|nr:hypothetical protein [Gammaproteobacteria bacterium]